MKNHLLFTLTLALFAFTFSACEDDQHDHGNDSELITTVTLTLTPAGGGTPVTGSWRDIDGTGGASPVISGLTLVAGTTYEGTISFLDESKSPVFNITEEVLDEAEEHQVFYTFSPSGSVTVTILDKDSGNLPLGLSARFVVSGSSAASLSLNIKLSHFDGGTKNGTTPSDENDVNVDIPVTVSAL